MDFQKNIFLKNYSNYRIGGPAKYFVEVRSVGELKEALKKISGGNERIFILGKGTKVLIDDQGFDGLVIYNNIGGITRKGENLIVGSGVLIKDILNYCLENSLSGFEWAGGLPGTMGGAVRGNAGAFEKETKDNVIEVKSLDLKTLEEKTRNNKECKFDYRDSIFKSGNAASEIITSAILKLEPGSKKEIEEKIKQKINCREKHQPLDYPSLGSTFENIPFDSLPKDLQKEFFKFLKTDPFPIIPVTKILALCGLKGRRIGGAIFSEKHTNFILNVDSATASDVKKLIEVAKKTVKEKFNIFLKEEIVYLN